MLVPSIRGLILAAMMVPLGPSAFAADVRALKLEEALALLDQQSLTLAQAKARAAETRALTRQAAAALLPQALVNGSYLRNSDSAKIALGPLFASLPASFPRPEGLPSETVIQPLEQFQASGTVRVPLFAANAYSDLSAASHAAKAAELSVEGARLQLRAVLVQAAWLASAAEETVGAAEKAVASATDHEQSTARALKAGTAAPLAHLQAQTEVVRRESDLARARAEAERAHLTLGVLLGKAEPVRIELPAPAIPARLAEEELVNQAIANRPELKAQQEALTAADRQVASAWWRQAPQVVASGSLFASDVAYPTGEKSGWRAMVEVSLPLYDGGFRYGKRRQAEATRTAATAALEAQRVEVTQQVLDAVRDIGVARERLRLAERQKALATEAAASASRSYSAGLVGNLDVIDANDRVFQADVGLADARARLGIAGAALARATGSVD